MATTDKDAALFDEVALMKVIRRRPKVKARVRKIAVHADSVAQRGRGGQVSVRSRWACAAVVSVAVGCASNRRRSMGSPVSSQ